ncbi:hypothetical protein ACFL2B_00270 [Patescibacteria group bacterium]
MKKKESEGLIHFVFTELNCRYNGEVLAKNIKHNVIQFVHRADLSKKIRPVEFTLDNIEDSAKQILVRHRNIRILFPCHHSYLNDRRQYLFKIGLFVVCLPLDFRAWPHRVITKWEGLKLGLIKAGTKANLQLYDIIDL